MAKKEQQQQHAGLQVVQGVDLERYQGRWYEIASMPSRFQPKDGRNTRATYTLKSDGSIAVLNETWSGGKRASIQGAAWKPDPSSPDAKFLVRFWLPPFLPLIPITGDYWIMRLDFQDYSWALIGQPSRKFLWILSRTPQLSEDIFAELVAYAEKEGYDVSKLQKTPQDEQGTGEEEANGGTVDDKGTWWLKSILGK